MSSSNTITKVRKDVLVDMMTCSICNKLFKEATTVSECLHTFCRKCIHKKLLDEELQSCPVCKVDLGCSPLEKLRPDHNLQDLRAKIFPFKKKESVTPVTRKERSLSSLVVDTPKVSPMTAFTGKRTKSTLKKASSSRETSFPVEKSVERKKDFAEDHPKSSVFLKPSNKVRPIFRQNSSHAESSTHLASKQKEENSAETYEGKVDIWKPMDFLLEVANNIKLPKSASQGSAAKTELFQTLKNELQVCKKKVKEHGTKFKVQEKKDGSDIPPPDGNKSQKFTRTRVNKVDYIIPPQPVVDTAIGNNLRRSLPFWFSLVASKDQEGDAQLPQISTKFLQIKDGTMPVSFIYKYLVKKLGLTNENEVEVKCLGQTVIPSLQMNSLFEFWQQSTKPLERKSVNVGSSAKDFVLLLAYGRKCASP